MRLRALVAFALLLATLPAVAQEGALPEGCERLDATTFTCFWTRAVDAYSSEAWEIPLFERTLATITVTLLDSPDFGWTVVVRDSAGAAVSEAEHPARDTQAVRHREQTTHVVANDPRGPSTLTLQSGHARLPLAGPVTGTHNPTARYEVAYLGELVPEGVVPERPAATREFPHLLDEPGGTEEPAWDLRAAWWDDARLGDGLFDVHLQVASLQELGPGAFAPPLGPRELHAFRPWDNVLIWSVEWTLTENGLGRTYSVDWRLLEGRDIARDLQCSLSVRNAGAPKDPNDPVLAHVLCDVDLEAGVLHATLPEASVGSPAPGLRFERPSASTSIDYSANAPDVVDEATTEAFPFALGGPRVWDELNGCRFCPPATSWYQAPLAPENVADTLQVLGTLAALATFLAGAALVWRRRRQTTLLLARVDEVGARDVDNEETLRALGRLEEEFTQLFRRGRITDAQYQVLTNRIAGVATRFALRRSLGLDDGVPGDAAPSRRLKVGEPADKRVRP